MYNISDIIFVYRGNSYMGGIIVSIFKYLDAFWVGFIYGGIFSVIFVFGAISIGKGIPSNCQYSSSKSGWNCFFKNK